MEPGTTNADRTVLNAEVHLASQEVGNGVLEQRVRRLEDTVTRLQDTKQLEDRIIEKVTERFVNHPAVRGSSSPALLLDAGRQLLPTAMGVLQAAPDATRRPGGVGQQWLIAEIYSEGRATLDMFFDPRYRPFLPWTVRVLPIGLILFFLFSHWLVPWSMIPLFGTIFDKGVGLALGIVAYKILSREARRYRDLFQR